MEVTKAKKRLLGLLKEVCLQTPDEGLLEIIGSCFAAGDISHISDKELEKNLIALRDLNKG